MPLDAAEDRRRWMSVLAQASPDDVTATWFRLADLPSYELLRRPETGLVMVRGRVGGDGAPFNLGEMTVTRCSVRIADGPCGHAWVQGRRGDHAERAAVLDALMQSPTARAVVAPEIDRLEALAANRRAEEARKAAATRVEFFTMVRGDD